MTCPSCLDEGLVRRMRVWQTSEDTRNIRLREYKCFLCNHREWTREEMRISLLFKEVNEDEERKDQILG